MRWPGRYVNQPCATPALFLYYLRPMNVDVRESGNVVIVDFSGRLALGGGEELLSAVVAELLTLDHKRILLNLTDVEYIDSSGLGELVQSYRACEREGAILKLLRPQERVRKSLHLSKLLPLFEVHDNEGEAVASFGD